ncbi:MAG: helicase-related protein, partial [Xanthobacteraceae bacterium]
GKVRTLVATDIAARGIDVDGISHVVNFDLPNVPETYVHRIGRTARAGAEGIAISLCDGEEMAFLRDIEKLIRMSLPISDRRSHPQRAEASAAEAAPGNRTAPGRHNGNGNRGQQRRRNGNGGGKQQPHHGQPHRERPHRADPRRGEPQTGQQRTGQPQADQTQDAGIATVAFLRRDAAPNRRHSAPRFTGQSRGS